MSLEDLTFASAGDETEAAPSITLNHLDFLLVDRIVRPLTLPSFFSRLLLPNCRTLRLTIDLQRSSRPITELLSQQTRLARRIASLVASEDHLRVELHSDNLKFVSQRLLNVDSDYRSPSPGGVFSRSELAVEITMK